jgi:LPXTG-site transpeptidase (sortase) family protein
MPSKKELSKYLLLALVFLGILTTVSGGYFYFVRSTDKKIPSPIAEEPRKETPRPLHSKPNPVRLVIAGVKIDLPITEGKIVDGVWLTTKTGASHLDISANPGENGNIVIYGHNLRAIFGSLPYVSMGALVKVTAEDGKEYLYKVYSKKTVKADDISIALATQSEVLTLYTCDGPLDSTRFVLQAELIK